MGANGQEFAKRPIAYSYVRFSTAGQLKGDSLERQVEACEAYCNRTGLELHRVSYRDLGVSAFKRKNIEKGALAAFILAVKSGKIAKGSYLIIEQFDRLSRAETDVALKLLLDLVHSGITLVTLVDEKVWDREAVNDVSNLVLAIVFMSRANNESAAKAARLSHVWGKKKKRASETGKILTRECPRWLRVNEDKSAFEIISDRVESIQKVFKMKTGGFGIVAITRRANDEHWPAPGKMNGWHTSLVGRLLKNRALLGEYQPCTLTDNGRVADGPPVLGYYPQVISEPMFLSAQAVAIRRGAFPGRRDKNSRNFLQGLLYCTCGKSFVRKNKASSKQPNYARYYCSGRIRQLSKCPSVGALEIETAIVKAVVKLGPQFFDRPERASELKAKADTHQVKLSGALASRDRYAEAIGTSAEPIPVLMQRLTAAQREVEAQERALASIRAEAAEAGEDSPLMFAKIVRSIHAADSVDARAELRENLSRIIIKCIIDPQASTVALHLRGREDLITVKLNSKETKLDTIVSQIATEMPSAFYEKLMCRMKTDT